MPRLQSIILIGILLLLAHVGYAQNITGSSTRCGYMCRTEAEPVKIGLLYVVDGNIKDDIADINPHSISDVTVLKPASASALFGQQGMNGAVIITLKKDVPIYKKLDTVIVKVTCALRKYGYRCGGTRMISECYWSSKKDTSYSIATKEESTHEKPINTIKLYPNPVNRSGTITVQFPLQQTGDHLIRVSNIAGTVVLQKKFHATGKQQQLAIPCESRWGAGIYYVWVLDETNKLVAKDSFIVQ